MKSKIFLIILLSMLFCISCRKSQDSEKNIINKTGQNLFKGADFTFAVYGESAGNLSTHSKIIKLISRYNVNLVVHTGNLIASPTSQTNWSKFFNIITPVSSIISRFYITPGNIEHNNIEEVKQRFANLSILMKRNPFYSFTYKNSLFMILNAYTDENELYKQHDYMMYSLKKFIKRKSGPIFVFTHKPVYSSGPSGVNHFLTRHWLILLEHFRVNIIFSGKDKLYGRYKTSMSTSAVCIVTGGAGEITDKCGKKAKEYETFACKEKKHFVYVGVKKNKIGVKVIGINNNVIDSFEINVANRYHVRKGIPKIYRPF